MTTIDKDSAGDPRRHTRLRAALLAGSAALALAFPLAAQAQGWHGHGGGQMGGSHAMTATTTPTHSTPMVHASANHGTWAHGGGTHGTWNRGGGWHRRRYGWGWGGGWWGPDYAYDYDWGYPYYDYGYYGPNYVSAWYCPNPPGYYPYVSQCYAPWQPAG